MVINDSIVLPNINGFPMHDIDHCFPHVIVMIKNMCIHVVTIATTDYGLFGFRTNTLSKFNKAKLITANME